jgi:hypothetical protein
MQNVHFSERYTLSVTCDFSSIALGTVVPSVFLEAEREDA